MDAYALHGNNDMSQSIHLSNAGDGETHWMSYPGDSRVADPTISNFQRPGNDSHASNISTNATPWDLSDGLTESFYPAGSYAVSLAPGLSTIAPQEMLVERTGQDQASPAFDQFLSGQGYSFNDEYFAQEPFTGVSSFDNDHFVGERELTHPASSISDASSPRQSQSTGQESDNTAPNGRKKATKVVSRLQVMDRAREMFANGKSKPPGELSYAGLLGTCLGSAPDKTMRLADIYAWFEINTDKTGPKGWRNSVRHNLSLNGGFDSIDPEGNVRDNYAVKAGCERLEELDVDPDAKCRWRLNDELPRLTATAFWRTVMESLGMYRAYPPNHFRKAAGQRGGKRTALSARGKRVSKRNSQQRNNLSVSTRRAAQLSRQLASSNAPWSAASAAGPSSYDQSVAPSPITMTNETSATTSPWSDDAFEHNTAPYFGVQPHPIGEMGTSDEDLDLLCGMGDQHYFTATDQAVQSFSESTHNDLHPHEAYQPHISGVSEPRMFIHNSVVEDSSCSPASVWADAWGSLASKGPVDATSIACQRAQEDHQEIQIPANEHEIASFLEGALPEHLRRDLRVEDEF